MPEIKSNDVKRERDYRSPTLQPPRADWPDSIGINKPPTMLEIKSNVVRCKANKSREFNAAMAPVDLATAGL